MKSKLIVTGVLIAACSTAWGGIADLGTEMAAFTGMREFRATYPNGTQLSVDVDFAVFAPGGYSAAALAFSGYGVPNAQQYVYAYQLKSLPSSTVPLSFFTVDLGADAAVSGVGYNGSEGVRNASSATLRPTYIRYNFNQGQLLSGEHSYFLLFSSPNPPIWANSSIIDGGTSMTIPSGLPAPGPIPAPGAVLLGALGLVGVKAARRALS
jgi:hypothetical protein